MYSVLVGDAMYVQDPNRPSFFEDIKAYVGFDESDSAALRAFHAIAEPHLPRMADHFFERIDRHPGARAVFTDAPLQMQRLKGAIGDWLRGGLAGPHDEAFCAERARLGRLHVAMGLPQRYIFTGINVLRLDYRALVHAHVGDDWRKTGDAVDKLLDLELAIFLRSYQEESEERLIKRERRAQAEKLSAMQALTSGLAHEVRNPLNAARLQLELLERRLRRISNDPKLLEPTALVHDEINRLSELLQEFLDFARPTAPSTGEHDLVTLVRAVIELQRQSATDHTVQLNLVGDPPPLLIAVDGIKLHQVIVALVRNAVEAVAGAGGNVEVELRGSASDDFVQLFVRDDGPGIPGELRERIYEPFYSTKQGGTGLGLAIVHSVVAMHGGEVIVRCERGTEFEIRLPTRPIEVGATR